MRFFKAAEIACAEADRIKSSGAASATGIVVIEFAARWFDVRRLTHAEIRSFIEQLAREDMAARRGALH